MFLEKRRLYNALKVAGIIGIGLYTNNTFAYGSAGIGLGGFGDSEYKNYEGGSTVIPMINISDDIFFFRGLSAGAYLYNDEKTQLSTSLTYFAKEYNASDSDNVSMKLLDDRDSTGLLDIAYRSNMGQLGSVTVKGSVDILDETDGGFLFDISYGTRLSLIGSKAIKVIPGFGLTWYNDKFNEHYYGISSKEAAVSGLGEYHPSSSFVPYVSLGVNLGLSKAFGIFINTKISYLPDEIKDSPMVDRRAVLSGIVGANYNF